MKLRKASLALLLLCAESVSAGPPAGAVFTPTPAPRTDEERVKPLAASTLVVTGASGTVRTWPLQHHVLFSGGDRIGGGTAGLIVDARGAPLLRTAPDAEGHVGVGPFVARAPDANTLVQLPGAARRLALVTHYEFDTTVSIEGSPAGSMHAYRLLPMMMTVTTLKQHARTGLLAATELAAVDFRAARGLWTPCNASLSPWGTHLGGEEYEPDARHFEHAPLEPMNLFLGTPGKDAARGGANPYDYGHVVEVKVSEPAKAEGRKRYAMGRLSFELADVLPDERTAIFGDDAIDGVRFMFVADRQRDLSAGRLYAARWKQTSAAGAGAADLEWIPLGHATENEIAKLVRDGIVFSDIFETSPRQAPGFRAVHVYPGTTPEEWPKTEWLRVKPGREQAAAFLESRRFAGWAGATTEFVKMEGIAHSGAHRKQYTAISHVGAGMLAGKNAARPRDDIHIEGDAADLACGVVYESDLAGGVKDRDGALIPSNWVPVNMRPFVAGARSLAEGASPGACDVERIAGPDNLSVSEALDVLFIGEDTTEHANNFAWAVPLAGGPPVRIFSAPAGAEVSGLRAVDDARGFGYVLVNVQHPGSMLEGTDSARFAGSVDQRGSVGYLGPFRLGP